jgi:hypothetical protein
MGPSTVTVTGIAPKLRASLPPAIPIETQVDASVAVFVVVMEPLNPMERLFPLSTSVLWYEHLASCPAPVTWQVRVPEPFSDT